MENYILLQNYWWIIISLLGGILVFLLFVQGGQTLICTIGKNEIEQRMLINCIGRKWGFTFTTLVTFGGAFFASFPLFYSTSFGGAYWVWIAILLCFVIQAVSYEFRSQENNFLGKKTYDTFLFINGLLGTILLGAAVATFFTGSQFSVDTANITNGAGGTAISRWQTPVHGLEAVLNITNVSLGLAVFFLARVLATMYFINSIDHEEILKRSRKQLLYNTIPFLVFFLFFVGSIIIRQGFAMNPDTGEVFMEKMKYLNNLAQMPAVLALFLAGVVLVLCGIAVTLFKKSTKGIWYSGIGTIFVVMALFMIAGFNNTAYYPSTYDIQSSLTIRNSSSSKFTLTAMSYVSLIIPFVLAYIVYAWRQINKKKITESEMMNENENKY